MTSLIYYIYEIYYICACACTGTVFSVVHVYSVLHVIRNVDFFLICHTILTDQTDACVETLQRDPHVDHPSQPSMISYLGLLASHHHYFLL